MKNKAIAAVVSLVLVLAISLPVSLSLSSGTDSKQSAAGTMAPAAQTASAGTGETAETAETGETGETGETAGTGETGGTVEQSAPAEADVPAAGEPEAALYDRLMAAETADDFMAIIEQTGQEELNALSDSELDNLDDYYVFLTTGEYPDHTPVVDEVMEIVNYTDVAPFGEPVTGGQN